MPESINPIQVHCSLEDSLAILGRWKDRNASLYVTANVGPARFSFTGKVVLIERETVHIESGSDQGQIRLRLLLSGGTFTFEDRVKWPVTSERSLPEGVTSVSALIANLFVEEQLVGDCVLMEFQKPL